MVRLEVLQNWQRIWLEGSTMVARIEVSQAVMA
jgi:hypothetical protein